jgi:D-alanyl-D-alanine carboxypeptidase (penicillin-binding protein 5/6)
MAVTAKRDGMRLIAIVLGEPKGSTRNEEISELLDYGFNTYKVNNFMEKDSVVDEIYFDKGTLEKVNIYLKENASILMKQSDSINGYDTEIELDRIALPLKSGDVVGKYLIKKNNDIINKIDLIVKDDVNEKNFFELFLDILKDTLIV